MSLKILAGRRAHKQLLFECDATLGKYWCRKTCLPIGYSNSAFLIDSASAELSCFMNALFSYACQSRQFFCLVKYSAQIQTVSNFYSLIDLVHEINWKLVLQIYMYTSLVIKVTCKAHCEMDLQSDMFSCKYFIPETLLRARQICSQYIDNSDIQSTASESEMKRSRKIR
jgi:hypothetical protein